MSAYCCIKLDLLLTLNHDARNHEFKMNWIVCRTNGHRLFWDATQKFTWRDRVRPQNTLPG